jgi:hypothetical protein
MISPFDPLKMDHQNFSQILLTMQISARNATIAASYSSSAKIEMVTIIKFTGKRGENI